MADSFRIRRRPTPRDHGIGNQSPGWSSTDGHKHADKRPADAQLPGDVPSSVAELSSCRGKNGGNVRGDRGGRDVCRPGLVRP